MKRNLSEIFSWPSTPDMSAFISAISQNRSTALIKATQHYLDGIESNKQNEINKNILKIALKFPQTFSKWEPWCGQLSNALKSKSDRNVYLSIAQIGLKLVFESHAEIAINFALSIDDSLVIGSFGFCNKGNYNVVKSAPNSIIISESETNETAIFLHSDNKWTLQSTCSFCEELPSIVRGDYKITFLTKKYAPNLLLPKQTTAEYLEYEKILSFLSKVGNALEILNKNCLNYYSWCASTITYVAPAKTTLLGSGSHVDFPGLIVMSEDERIGANIEMLVHEASHQNFFASELIMSSTNDLDNELYYSCLAQRNRPLDKFLLAYHAFANIKLSMLLMSDVNDYEVNSYCHSRALSMTENLEMETVLKGTNGLTESGIALWKPVSKQLSSY